MRYSIKPIIRDDKPVKKNGKYPIYYSIRFNNLQVKSPTGIDIEKKFWNNDLGRVKNSFWNCSEINAVLDNKIAQFQSSIV